MKKLYTLSLVLFACVLSFGQTFYSENFGSTATVSPYPLATDFTGYQNTDPITYTGTADVRPTAVSSGYAGASGVNNMFFNAETEFLQIDGLDTSAYASADIQLTFGTNSTTSLVLQQSVNGTDWTDIVYANVGASWHLVTIGAGSIPSSSTLSLRWTATSTAQIRIDDVKLSSASSTCLLSLGTPTTLCDAFTVGTDTYTATIPFTGGGTATYGITASAGTIGGDNPSTNIIGNIVITGIPEGTPVTVGVTGGTCNLSADITAARCAAINSLPFNESFDYPEAQSLGLQQKWSNANTGDDVTVAGGNLSYPGLTPTGNSIVFGGGGFDTFATLTPTTAETLYYSYLITVNTLPTEVQADANGGYISGLGESITDLGATLWTKRVDDTNFNFGIEVRTGTGVNTTWTTGSYQTGETYFVVVGYMFVDGLANDMVDLWINPVVGAAQTAPLLFDAHTGTDFTSIDNFFFRQDSDGETPAGLQIDQLRVGTTWESVTDGSLSVGENNISGLKMYPNPVSNGTLYINTNANAEKTVVIFDVLGKQVVNTTTSTNAVNVSNLKGGVYIVKITEEGKTATRKLVIR